MLEKLRVTIDTVQRREMGTVIHVIVTKSDEPSDLHIQQIVPTDDFESYWDQVWNSMKRQLDKELKNAK